MPGWSWGIPQDRVFHVMRNSEIRETQLLGALRAALGVGEDGLLVLTTDGAEVVPLGAFRPVTRAGIRLAREARTS